MAVKKKKSVAKPKTKAAKGKSASKTAAKKVTKKKAEVKTKTAKKKVPTKKAAKKESTTKKSTAKKTSAKKTASKKTVKRKPSPKSVSKKKKTVSKKTAKKPVKKTIERKATAVKKKAKKKSDAKKYEEVRLLLEKRKAEILKEVAGDLSEGLNSETVAYPDLSDLASIESDKNFEIRIKERERRLLKKINLALEQIKNGTFGICERCGEEIGLKRLLARPVATLCIQCKTEAEREEKARNL